MILFMYDLLEVEHILKWKTTGMGGFVLKGY